MENSESPQVITIATSANANNARDHSIINPYDAMSLEDLKLEMQECIESLRSTDTTGPEWDQLRASLLTILAQANMSSNVKVEETEHDGYLALHQGEEGEIKDEVDSEMRGGDHYMLHSSDEELEEGELRA